MDTPATSRDDRSWEDRSWYVEKRPRLLARYFFLKDERLRVEDVSDQDPAYDLLISGDLGRGAFSIGVVTSGFEGLPEHEVASSGEPFHETLLFSPSPFRATEEIDDAIPTLFAVFDVVEDRGAVAMLTRRSALTSGHSIEFPALLSSPESETPLAVNRPPGSESAVLFTPMEAFEPDDLCRLTLRAYSLLDVASASSASDPTIETYPLPASVRRRIANLRIQGRGRST
jgi:hypothetical protein